MAYMIELAMYLIRPTYKHWYIKCVDKLHLILKGINIVDIKQFSKEDNQSMR